MEETGTISKNTSYERRMLKIEGVISFWKRSNLQMLVCSCHPASFHPFSFKLRLLSKCYMLFLVINFVCLSDEFQIQDVNNDVGKELTSHKYYFGKISLAKLSFLRQKCKCDLSTVIVSEWRNDKCNYRCFSFWNVCCTFFLQKKWVVWERMIDAE